MKRNSIMTAIVILAFAGCGETAQDAQEAEPTPPPAAEEAESTTPPAEPQALESEKDKASYAVGVQMGNFIKHGVDFIEMDIVQRGLADAIGDTDLAMDEASLQQAFMGFEQQVRAEQQAAVSVESEKAKAEGEAFLQANVGKEGIVVMPSGLQYKVIDSGDGGTPGPTDMVLANYRGTFIDGSEFDSSYTRGEPSKFPVNRVIAGWTEALQLMKVGDKWELYIPYDLAYGAQGRAGIPGYSMLIFEIELVEINPVN